MSRAVRLCAVVVLTVVLAPVKADHGGGSSPVVSTQQGRVSGVSERSTQGRVFHSYYNIPFAEPPVGDLRFKLPVPAKCWSGVREGSHHPVPCIQVSLQGLQLGNITKFGREDCLYLNVFTPKPRETANLPVMVWIHGGGYLAGSTEMYQPYALLNHDNIVLVTLQYRLGVFGFLSTEDEALPGNLGLYDQLAALRWVKDNIRGFGGDPEQITLAGQSAGAGSTHLLLLSPKTKGLIQRAILQSGAALCPWAYRRSHRKVTLQIAQEVGCASHLQESHALVQCLRGVQADTLLKESLVFVKWQMLPLVMSPRVDGDFLPAAPEVLATRGDHPRVPIISGYTAHDGGLIATPTYGHKHIRSALLDNFKEVGPSSLIMDESEDAVKIARDTFDYYLGGLHLQEENADDFVKMMTDQYFRVCQDQTSLLHARAVPGHTYSYNLAYRGQHSCTTAYNNPLVAQRWVTHSDEMFYLFPGNHRWASLSALGDLHLRDIITTLWTNFVATGNPTPDNSLGFKWEPTSATHLQYLSLTTTPSMMQESGQQVQAREFLSSLPTHANQLLWAEEHQESQRGKHEL